MLRYTSGVWQGYGPLPATFRALLVLALKLRPGSVTVTYVRPRPHAVGWDYLGPDPRDVLSAESVSSYRAAGRLLRSPSGYYLKG